MIKMKTKQLDWLRYYFWNSVQRLGLLPKEGTLKETLTDDIAPFDEYPPCEMCGSNDNREILVTRGGYHIVECINCGLWFTSPRISEKAWIDYLFKATPRSIVFTENRLKYGVALPYRTKFSSPNWQEQRTVRDNVIIDGIYQCSTHPVERLHDAGCGVGFLIRRALDRGIEATGNDLNAYACEVMRKRFGLKVYHSTLPELKLNNKLDAIVFSDYIEHTYHPLRDLKVAYRFLKPGGVIWIKTFKVDCKAFERLGANWNMLVWNHCYHFSTKTLQNMVAEAGFTISYSESEPKNDEIIKVIAVKEAI